jgi:hypothetical protein
MHLLLSCVTNSPAVDANRGRVSESYSQEIGKEITWDNLVCKILNPGDVESWENGFDHLSLV